MTPRLLVRLLAPPAVLAAAALLASSGGGALAQGAEAIVTGTVRSGTAGATLPDGVRVDLIALAADGALSAQRTATQGGRFEFRVPVDASVTHILMAVHEGVTYFADETVRLTPEQPAANREIIVYELAAEMPDLRLRSSVLTVVELDRSRGELTLMREDRVVNPLDRTYVGDDRDITLRLPVPDGTLAAGGWQTQEGTFTLVDGSLSGTVPLRPGVSTVVTWYVASYDRARDTYLMRLTVPLPAERIALQVPERFVDSIHPLGGSVRGEDAEIGGERMLVIVRPTEAPPGASAVAELRGLSGRQAPNPLTERGGAAVGGALALGAMAGGYAVVRRLAARATDRADEGGSEA